MMKHLFVFNLRNKFYVRNNLFNKKIIKFENHFKWFVNPINFTFRN